MVCSAQTVVGGVYTDKLDNADRVLLMNKYSSDESTIVDQGYEFIHALDDEPAPAAAYNLAAGTEFCYSNATVRTWHLTEVRIGNTFDSTGVALGPAHNYLPWQRIGAMQFTNSNVQVHNQRDTGHIAMRNTAQSRIVSPKYDDGIGRIYFDAVNFSVDTTNAVALSVCTNLAAAAEADWETNAANWVPAEVAVYAITNSLLASATTATNATLAMATGGSTNNFYRIVLSDPRFVNYREGAYFKIARADDEYAEDPECEGMVLIDNIICSYPVPTVTIAPPGTDDSRAAGERTLGWPLALTEQDGDGALTPVLASFGATNLASNARVEYVTNRTDLGAVSVTNLQFRYRWRYLDQDVLGVPGSGTLASAGGYASQASISGAELLLPAVDGSFKQMPVLVNAITLANNGVETAPQVKYLRIATNDTVWVSKILNGTGNADIQNDDGSFRLRYEFDPAVEVRTATAYTIEFLDQYGSPITSVGKMCVTYPAGEDASDFGVKVKAGDLAKFGNKNFKYLKATVECAYESGYDTVELAASATDPGQWQGKTALPLKYTAKPGDIEFYYTALIDTPYYRFVDYAGAGVTWLADDFEAPGELEFRRQGAELTLPSCGIDYFARLRDGRSELKSFDVEYCGLGSTADRQLCSQVALVGDMNWVALLPTPSNGVCRVRARTVDANNITNYLDVGDWEYKRWPSTMSVARLVPAGDDWVDSSNAWTRIEYDGTTSYLRFRYIESSGAIAVSRSEFQNFDGWNDAANRHQELFVGTGTHTNGVKVSGVANDQVAIAEDFVKWKATTVTNSYWHQSFDGMQFGSGSKYVLDADINATTGNYNGYDSSNGRYINKKYGNSGNGYALQLYGKGFGATSFTQSQNLPRGLEQLEYSARLAQIKDYKNFAVYRQGQAGIDYAGMLTNYAFVVRGRMGNASAGGHDGDAQLSLVAHHDPYVGCYEFRISHLGGEQYRYDLYRWNYDEATGAMVPTCLVPNSTLINIGTSLDADGKNPYRALAMFISVENYRTKSGKDAVHILAGVQKKDSSKWNYDKTYEGCAYGLLVYNDSSDDRLETGSFGVASINCKGEFFAPTYCPAIPTNTSWNKWYDTLNIGNGYSNQTISFAGTGLKNSLGAKNGWHMGQWMQSFSSTTDSAYWGVRCRDVAQDLILGLRTNSDSDFTSVVITNKVSSFELAPGSFQVHSRDKCAIRLAVGGTNADAIQTDVVLSEFGFTQWSGSDYNSDTSDVDTQTYFIDPANGSRAQTVFTSAWVHDTSSSEAASKCVELNASRSSTNRVVSLRSPLMGGESDEVGIGLGMVAFSYTNCNENVNLLVQIATNTATSSVRDNLAKLTSQFDEWVTITNFSGSAVAAAKQGIPLKTSGVASCYLGMHAVQGVMRIVMDPDVVAASYSQDDPAYGRIFVREVVFRDEPSIDLTCWWGWNLRTGNFLHEPNDGLLQYLADGSPVALAEYGMSGALNCSVTDKTVVADQSMYEEHLPFIQTPTFPDNDASKGITNAPSVGEISFKARRYDTEGSNVVARITLYGATDGNAIDANWTYLTYFDIENNVYTNFTYSRLGDGYKAYRLAVAGVKKADGTTEIKMGNHTETNPVVRVAIDNVYLAETIQPEIKFENVMAFRNDLDTIVPITADPKSEQPLLHESFGIQAEVSAVQLGEEVDFSTLKVKLYWKKQENPWGYESWRDDCDEPAELTLCDGFVESDGRYVFRSTTAGDPRSILSFPTAMRYEPVQYILKAEFYVKDHSGGQDEPVKQTHTLSATDWERPYWYNGKDYNSGRYAGGRFAAYTILDTIAPGWAWLNEINLMDAYSTSYPNLTNQYVEIAVPAQVKDDMDLANWKLRFIAGDNGTWVTNTVTLGQNGIAASKAVSAAAGSSDMVFLVVGSPAMAAADDYPAAAGQFDGSWGAWSNRDGSSLFGDNGQLNVHKNLPVAIQLLRANGIIEHQVVAAGTNTIDKARWPSLWDDASPEKLAENLNKDIEDGTTPWIVAGFDCIEGAYSLSVTNELGVAATDWGNTPVCTPGAINQGQTIAKPPVPAGDIVVIRATIDPAVQGLIWQFDPRNNTNTAEQVSFTVRKGDLTGTNIVYRLKPFHELANVKIDGEAIAAGDYPAVLAGTNVTLAVGANISNDIQVVASARLMPELTDAPYRLSSTNDYYNAVIDWLAGGQTLRGSFDNPLPAQSSDIKLAKFLPYSGDMSKVQDLSLIEMYWLDIDPTSTNGLWYLKAGFVGAIPQMTVQTNLVDFTFYMCITNDTTGVAYAPYTLRDKNGKLSQTCPNSEWAGPTFQITAWVNNGYALNQGFLPVDWYIFDGVGTTSKSFKNKGDPAEFTAKIEMLDPHSPEALGSYYGFDEFTDITNNPTFFRWKLDDLREIPNVGVKKL